MNETRTVEVDGVEVELSAYTDKLYIKYPREDRRGKSEYCLGYLPIFKAMLNPTKRRGGSFNARKFHPEGFSGVAETLKDAFVDLMDGVEDEPYWRGFMTGYNTASDSHKSLRDFSWRVFKRQWGNAGDDWKVGLLLDVGEVMVRNGKTVSNRSNDWFEIPDWGRPKGSYVATVSASEAGECPSCGADLSETQVCVSSSNRTRVPNKYKCSSEEGGCGYGFEGITTG